MSPAALADIPPESRRGAAFGDINNDGNIDVVLVNVGAPPTLLLNQGGNSNHRALFKLAGTQEQPGGDWRAGYVKAGKLAQFSEVRAGGSYISQNDPRLHFGLGAETRMSEVEISGRVAKWKCCAMCQQTLFIRLSKVRGSRAKFHCRRRSFHSAPASSPVWVCACPSSCPCVSGTTRPAGGAPICARAMAFTCSTALNFFGLRFFFAIRHILP